ncbi:hypothetical protein OQY15_09720 [Pedobacter sp. MC2016-15]|uniref:hypothetical protein n=1 Tax=Pedobacter sp. MC2016-15 TaxID=2994473 RepID=UPI0022465995|nr:hypothetical protein [Pedobacter sp. MC2016-15]MCX2479367.1 hypothetical protein [Pedobacter sp. MC2016-15]
MSKYDKFIFGLINEKWSRLGSELSDALIEKFGVEPDNARKIIQRATNRGTIISSTPLTFGKGQFLYAKPGQYFGLDMVREASKNARKPLHRLLELLKGYHLISFYEGLKITASPDEKGSTKISMLVDMVNDLEKLGIVFTKTDGWGNNYILTKEAFPPEWHRDVQEDLAVEQHLRSMKLDTILIPDILLWLKKINLVDSGIAYRNVITPGTGVKVNDVMWDAFAFTKTTGINSARASESNEPEKQTLVVLDVVIHRKYLQVDLDGFLARVQINLNSVKEGKRKAMPIIVFNEIDEITLNRAKLLGFLSFDIKTMFGRNITAVIENFKSIFGGQELALAEIEPVLEAIEQSGHTEELRSIRSALFEALMHPVIKRFYPNSQVLQSRLLSNPKKKKIRKFDLIFISSHPKEIILVELKGYTGKSFIRLGDADTRDTLQYFIKGSIPVAKEYYKADGSLSEYKITALYITTGSFHSDTKDLIIKSTKNPLKPSQFDIFIDGEKLSQLLTENEFNHEAELITKYFPKTTDIS